MNFSAIFNSHEIALLLNILRPMSSVLLNLLLNYSQNISERFLFKVEFLYAKENMFTTKQRENINFLSLKRTRVA